MSWRGLGDLFWVGFVLALAPAPVHASQERVMPLPAWVLNPEVTIERPGSIPETRSGAAVRVPCGMPDAIARWTFANAEPFDSSVEALCTLGALRPVPAAHVMIRATTPTPTTVQWLTPLNGALAAVVATRDLPIAEDGTTILVATAAEDRWIRVLRGPGIAPVTLSRATFSLGQVLLPEAEAGGELLVRVPDGTIRPVGFVAEGPHRFYINASGVRLSRGGGLPDGTYAVSPVYEGGLTGASVEATLESGQSTVVPFDLERLGGIAVNAAASVCSNTRYLKIRSVPPEGSGVPVGDTLIEIEHGGLCDRLIAGLPAGSWQVVYGSGEIEFAEEAFATTPQNVTDVFVDAEDVTVSGVVSHKFRNGADLTIQFRTAGRSSAEASQGVARLGSDGFYTLKLKEPGRYRMALSADGLVLNNRGKEVVLVAGSNVVDWDAESESLTVRIDGWDGAGRVLVNIEGPEGGDSIVVETLADVPLEIAGLGTGSYRLQARQVPGDRVSAWHETEVDPGPGDQDVVLNLEASRTTLFLEDETGAPIQGASVVAFQGQVEPVGAGAYVLTGVGGGTPIDIAAPGFSPRCRLASGTPEIRLMLSRGRQVQLQYSHQLNGGPAGLVLADGDDCPVRVRRFPVLRIEGRNGGPDSFLIGNFPRGSSSWMLEPGSPVIRLDPNQSIYQLPIR